MTPISDPSQACTVVDSGQSEAVVILGKKARRHCVEAVQELVTGIAKATGVRIFIDGSKVFNQTLEPVRPAPTQITFNLAATEAGLGSDGFHLKVEPEGISFFAGAGAGFANAVYYFLETYCGFRWLWPGEQGEVFDQLDKLIVPVGEIREKPDYQWRHLLFGDMPEDQDNKWGIQEFHMQCSPSCHALLKQWLQRNRMGGLKVMIGHTWGHFVNPDRYGRQHLEYFAEINGSRQASIDNFDGKHGGQLCTSNPEVIDLLVRRVREQFDRCPSLDVISISPNDGTGFCECEACIATDIKYGNPPPRPLTGPDTGLESTFKDDADSTLGSRRITGPITDRMFEFANKIAAQIARSHPDKLLLLLVYSLYRDPPRQVRLADNIIAQFCVSCHQHWEPSLRTADYNAIADLSAMTGEIGIYEYYDQGAWPGLTRSFPDLIVDSIRFFHRRGVRHYSVQASTGFAANGFNLWLLSRALWRTEVSVDFLLEDYCRTGFGPAAAAMQAYFELWRQRWRECKGIARMGGSVPGSGSEGEKLTPFEQILHLYPPFFMTEAESLLAAAAAAVDPRSPEHGRIEFFKRALKGAEIMLAAASFSIDLRDRGWPLTGDQVTGEAVAALGEPDEVMATAREGLRLWGRWEACLETVRDDFVFSFFWARYCYDSRKSLHPHWALQQIVQTLEPGTADGSD